MAVAPAGQEKDGLLAAPQLFQCWGSDSAKSEAADPPSRPRFGAIFFREIP